MPKGSKKRKAARRRQQLQLLESASGIHHHLPDSPTNSTATAASLSHGNIGPRHGHKRMDTSSSSSSSDDEEATPVKSIPDAVAEANPPPPTAADVPEGPADDKEVVVESKGPEDVVVVMVQIEEIREAVADESALEEGKGACIEEERAVAVAFAVPTYAATAPAVTEEGETNEAAAGTLEASLDVGALAHGPNGPTEVQPELALEAPISELAQECGGDVSGETLAASESSSRPPLLEHRASWWSCCGLFDVLGGSKDCQSINTFGSITFCRGNEEWNLSTVALFVVCSAAKNAEVADFWLWIYVIGSYECLAVYRAVVLNVRKPDPIV